MFKRSSRGDRYGSDEGYGNVEDLPRVLNSHLILTSHLWDGQHSLLYDVDTRTAIRKLRADVAERDMDS